MKMNVTRMAIAIFAAALLLGAAGARGQQPAPAPSAPADAQKMADMGPAPNPVSTTVKGQLPRFAKIMVAAADAMPAEKYTFKPTPEMNAFGHLVMHSTQANNVLCSKISGMAAPDVKYSDTDPKDKLVAALKASFDFCTSALANVDDSKLGDQMMIFGNRPSSRAAAMIGLSDGWNDHYGALAMYLRLSGILPPTAQPQPEKK